MMAPGRCVPTAFVEEAPLWLLFFPFFLLSPPHVFTNLDFVKTEKSCQNPKNLKISEQIRDLAGVEFTS
jgi:hypothetical protein